MAYDGGGGIESGAEAGASDAAETDSADDVIDETATWLDAGCSTADSGLGGIGIPSGTIATATTSYSTYTPDQAIDGNMSTVWDSGGYTGSLTLTFPSPVALDGVHVAADASPATTETYSIYGYVGTVATLIGTFTPSVSTSPPWQLPPMSVTPGTYDAIRLDVNGMTSWVEIHEISIETTGCP
jgi:hypothetical protein